MVILKRLYPTNLSWRLGVASKLRCRACNDVLTEEELLVYNMDSEPEDLCFECLGHVQTALEELKDE